ncbi:MAG: hypothetical protein LUQ66_10150 [Methanoregula sp.]|nr:hypothetical protein [Methanoregula sp.]
MAKIIGIKPQADTRKLIEKFEDEVMIRHNNQQLVGTVYIDMQENQWAVAFAYNYSRKSGIHGHENPLEVRYFCPVQESSNVRMFRSDSADEVTLSTEPLKDADAFVRFAIMQERSLAGKAA